MVSGLCSKQASSEGNMRYVKKKKKKKQENGPWPGRRKEAQAQ
jgi:hypothetical protein